MEVFKFILTNYGPVVASVFLMVYLCFFVKKAVNGNEKKLKDDISTLIRENAELKKALKENQKLMNEGVQKLNTKVEELNEQIDHICEVGEEDVRGNKES